MLRFRLPSHNECLSPGSNSSPVVTTRLTAGLGVPSTVPVPGVTTPVIPVSILTSYKILNCLMSHQKKNKHYKPQMAQRVYKNFSIILNLWFRHKMAALRSRLRSYYRNIDLHLEEMRNNINQVINTANFRFRRKIQIID